MRILTLTLAALESLVAGFYFAVFAFGGSRDPLGEAIASGVTAIVAALFVVFVLPSLVLAIRNTNLKLALALALAAIPAAAAAFVLA